MVDFLVGQYWHLFGWQPYFFPNSVEIQGLPGQLYERTPQVRLSHRFPIGGTSLELAAAALRPPVSDGDLMPDMTGGIRFAFDHWRGLQTTGATSTGVAPASIAVTADLRNFRLPVFQQEPTQSVSITTGAIAVDAFLPLIPPGHDFKNGGLSITGEFVYGGGIADMYTSLTGGITQPTIVNTSGLNPPPPYPGVVDNGMVEFDNAPGPKGPSCPDGLGAAGATSCHKSPRHPLGDGHRGLQWYVPGTHGRFWVAGNFAHTESPNIDQFTQATAPNPGRSGYTEAATVRKHEDWFNANVFFEPLPSVRIGFEYAGFIDPYVDVNPATNNRVTATNHRVQASGFFLF